MYVHFVVAVEPTVAASGALRLCIRFAYACFVGLFTAARQAVAKTASVYPPQVRRRFVWTRLQKVRRSSPILTLPRQLRRFFVCLASSPPP